MPSVDFLPPTTSTDFLAIDERFARASDEDRASRYGPRRSVASSACYRRGLDAGMATIYESDVYFSARDLSPSVVPGRDMPMNWLDVDSEIDRLLALSRSDLVDLYRRFAGRRPSSLWSSAKVVAKIVAMNSALADQTAFLAARRRLA